VMEYVEGDDLQKIVQDGGVLPVNEAAEIIRQSAEGLEAAHKAGLVHRDIKPSYILLDKEGQVHILDLGLARVEADEEASMTLMHNSKALGTVDYLAPEQARDSHAVDARADIYSLGCTLYFLLAGTPLFDEGTIPQRILAHQTQPPPDVRNVRPEVPDDLIKILEKMLAKERARRFASAGEVAGALEAFLAGKSIVSFLSTAEEAELMRIDLQEAAEPPPPKSLVAAAVAAAVTQPATVGAGSGSNGSAAPPASSASDGQSALPDLAPLDPPDLFAPQPPGLHGSDALLGALGDRDLAPLSSPTGFDTLSGQLDATQSLPIATRSEVLAARPANQSAATEQGSVRNWLVEKVATEAGEGEGIGGLRYKLWFLILFGIISGLIVAGTGYSVIRTLNSTPAAPQVQPVEERQVP
jgi:serine/threonine protein kinase